MQTRYFCYWLLGYFEFIGNADITPTQAKLIKNHFNMVFKHEAETAIAPAPPATTYVGPNAVPFSTDGNPTYMNGGGSFMLHASC